MLEVSRTPPSRLRYDEDTDADLLAMMHGARPYYSRDEGGPIYLGVRNNPRYTESFTFNPSAMPFIEAFAGPANALLIVNAFYKCARSSAVSGREYQLTLTLERRGQAIVKYEPVRRSGYF